MALFVSLFSVRMYEIPVLREGQRDDTLRWRKKWRALMCLERIAVSVNCNGRMADATAYVANVTWRDANNRKCMRSRTNDSPRTAKWQLLVRTVAPAVSDLSELIMSVASALCLSSIVVETLTQIRHRFLLLPIYCACSCFCMLLFVLLVATKMLLCYRVMFTRPWYWLLCRPNYYKPIALNNASIVCTFRRHIDILV